MSLLSFNSRSARWGLLASALVMGGVLLALALSSYKVSQQIAETVVLGQAERLLGAIRSSVRPVVGKMTRETLDKKLAKVLETHTPFGLRYIALVDGVGQRFVEAGELSTPFSLPDAQPPGGPTLMESGSSWIAALKLPPPHEREPPPWPNGPPGHPPERLLEGGPALTGGSLQPGAQRRLDQPDALGRLDPSESPGRLDPSDAQGRFDRKGRDGARPRPPLTLVIEFEPMLSDAMHARAVWQLWIGVAASLLLTVMVFFFWRQALRADAAEEKLHAQRRLAALGEMSSVLAHEIKNPLASLKGHAQLLEETLEQDSRPAKQAARVVKEAHRLEKLVLELLDFVRSGKVEREEVDIVALTRTAMEEVASDRFLLKCEAPAICLPLDRGRMARVLANLLRNALQASSEAERVEVEIVEEEKDVCLLIRDQGQGLRPGDEQSIFEPFVTHRTQGVGLGLAVARRITELHEGRLRARNREEGGAEFELRLPKM